MGRGFEVEGGKPLILAADLRAQLLPKLVGNLQENFNHGRIELGSGAAQNLFARGVEGARLAVRPVAGDGIERVADRKDARADGNLAAADAARIPATVVMLLVAVNDFRGPRQKRNL